MKTRTFAIPFLTRQDFSTLCSKNEPFGHVVKAIYGIIETLLLETNEQLIQFHTDLINCK